MRKQSCACMRSRYLKGIIRLIRVFRGNEFLTSDSRKIGKVRLTGGAMMRKVGGMARSNAMGKGCLTLFALPFAAVGLGSMGWLVWTLFRVAIAQSWVETPATILEASLEGGGGDSSARAVARYSYTFAGSTYESTKVSFYSGSDNIGSFQKDAAAELSRYVAKPKADAVEMDSRTRGPQFRCYVNPHKPEEAVLYRTLRIGMMLFQLMFGVIFGGVGFGLMFSTQIAARFAKKKQERIAQFPGEPWKWREDWASGVVRVDRKTARFALFFAAFWNAISFPMAIFLIPQAIKQHQNAAWFVLIFPAVGTGLAIWAFKEWARVRRFGNSTLQLATQPGVIGGKFAGLVRLPLKIHAADGFHVTLKCVRTVTTGSGDDRRTVEQLLWEQEKVLAVDASKDLTQTALPVLFAVPFEQPPTEPDSPAPVSWRVEVKATNPGIDLNVRFEVPIFKTAESSPDFVLDDAAIRPFLGHVEPRDELATQRIRIEQTARGTAYVFPPARFIGGALLITVIAIIWTGVVVGMLIARAHHKGPPLIFPIVFGFFDIFILLGFLDAWLGTGRIEIERDTLRWRSGILGIGTRGERTAARDCEFAAVTGQQVGNNLRYAVAIVGPAGKKTKITREFTSKHAAEAFIAELKRQLERS